ncbi:PREDICTED: piezo-type mechanosensitive ion channel component 1 isoform X1 [Lepidothrix coronata]|uniref:Piezo-type mechanosensitive ion channel component 1 isoform X1 n=1 Tax=Lepidothrix coronata TaxID=321398 RepID=A0A6J0HCB8_9PASS|nr:PREDICTED: piezo-type mechanosensitive ion channel component 1 isoform X1 [Lepidothrix coronata]
MQLRVFLAGLYWLVLPLSLLAACIFRFNVFSLVYLLFLLILPWFSGPKRGSATGHAGCILKCLLATSSLFVLAHLVFQIGLYTIPSWNWLREPNCSSSWEVLFEHIGVTRLYSSDIPNVVRLVAPDVGILLISVISLCLCRLMPKTYPASYSQRPEFLGFPELREVNVSRHRCAAHAPRPLGNRLLLTAHWLLWEAGKGLANLLLALAGIILPSASSSIYYLFFLGLCLWWACHLPTSRQAFNILYVLVGVYSSSHLLCLYVYQTPFVQRIFPPSTIWARLFGFKDIILYHNCSQTNTLELNTSHPWPVYANPGILLLLCYAVATVVKLRWRYSWRTMSWPELPARVQMELENWPRDTDSMAEDTDSVAEDTGGIAELTGGTAEDTGGVAGDTSGMAEVTEPMLPSGSEGPNVDTENCTVHVMNSQQCKKRTAEWLPLRILAFFIMRQSYICALISMLVWSITYHSWLTFVLLLWSCLIWTVRDRRNFAMLCSPFILLYGIALCSLNYVWSMDLVHELPTYAGFMSLHQLGLMHHRKPFFVLGAKLLLILPFWPLLRQFIEEKVLKRPLTTKVPKMSLSESEVSHARDMLQTVGSVLLNFFAKFWICVCGGMFIVVSFIGRLVVYKIVYMLLFLLCLILFQVYYSLWRKVLKGFWWLVVAYTMLVLIASYTYQFEDFPMYWRNLTGLTDNQLKDMGLEQFSVSELFYNILILGFFLLACILQLHYFHEPFMYITDLQYAHRPSVSIFSIPGLTKSRRAAADSKGARTRISRESLAINKWKLVLERLAVLGQTFSNMLTRVEVFVRRLLELHILKLVALYTVWVALEEVSVMNFLLVLLWTLAMPYCRFRRMASCLSTVWTCVIIVCKMLYQLEIVEPREYSNNCTQPLLNATNLSREEMGNSTLYRGPVDPANWFGVRKGFPNLGYVKNHLQVLLLLVFEAVVYRRQQYHRVQHCETIPITETIFPEPESNEDKDTNTGRDTDTGGDTDRDTDTDRDRDTNTNTDRDMDMDTDRDMGRDTNTDKKLDRDRNLVSCAKYLVNYFYYKFGLEICFLMMVTVIGQRMNFLVILHGCWLVVMMTLRRRAAIARLWPKYCLFLVIFFLYQYLLCVGMPPALCVDYPWRWNVPMNSALIKWLYLPDFIMPPKSTNLINDFLLLMCAAQQWRVFEAERSKAWQEAAGDNEERFDHEKDPYNPKENFLLCRCYLDMVKVVIFRHLFWFVLVVVFITGSNRISLFGLGYLLACFYLLLFGTAMLCKPTRPRLVVWDCLILYNITVIISKNMLSLLSCVFVHQMQNNFCWVIQLFSLVCTVTGYYDPKEMGKDLDCSLPVEEAGIILDSICFFFLLVQRRIFLSSYYVHVLWDLRASTLQPSRGVVLFQASITKNLHAHRRAERKSLAQLKRQMERIRAKQDKYRQEQLSRSITEEQDEAGTAPRAPVDPFWQRERWWRPGLDHAGVLHSGEYYLFESDSEEEEEEVPEELQSGRQGPFQLIHQAMTTNTKTVLRQQERREQPRAESAAGDRGGREAESEAEEPEHEEEVTVTGSGLSAEQSNVLHRALNMLRFLWLLCQAVVDGLTQWMEDCTREYLDMFNILYVERYRIAVRLASGQKMNEEILDELYIQQSLEQIPEQPPEQPPEQLPEGPPEGPPEELSPRRSLTTDSQNGAAARQVQRDSPREQLAVPQTVGLAPPEGSQEQLMSEGSQEDVAGSQQRLSVLLNRRRTAGELLLIRKPVTPPLNEAELFYQSHNRFLKLLLAGYHCVTAHSELVCYFIIILNNIVSASIISLFLPILIFLWAMLSIPRPTKRFWMTAIIFTEVMLLVKYLFQFGFFPWNSYTTLLRNEGKPFFPPRILGLEKSTRYLKYDLFQLLALFFHRSLLQGYGLWDYDEDALSKMKMEAKWAEEEEKWEEAAPPSLMVSEEGMEAPEEPGAPDSNMRSESEGDAMEQEEGSEAMELRCRKKTTQGRKTPEEGSTSSLLSQGWQGWHRHSMALLDPNCSVCLASLPGVGEKTGEAEETHAQRKLNAFGLWVKCFFLTTAQSMYQPVRKFFKDILHTENRAATDVYAFMFLVDVVDFIIIVFGFWAFGKHTAATDITSSLSENQVPQAFLVMLLFQFTTMIIDRALYLRKTVLGKLIFQVVLVFGIHVWMFFIVPAVTERLFNLNMVAQLWYFVKCIYFALSAYQIRCGYPTRILGNFLTKKYNYLNLFLFQGFRLVPFLVELRAVMDWVWTDTTLSLSNWMCVEDIYANIFIIKCSRETEKKYPQPKGQKKKKVVKYGMGGLIILFLVCIIWFPLLFMSLVRSVVGIVNHPIDVTVTLQLGGYEPLFTMSAQQQSIKPFTPDDYEDLTRHFDHDPVAMQFITLYGYEDIVTVRIEGSSGSLWSVSPPSREQMRQELLNSSSDITVRFSWSFQRDLGKGGTVETAFDKHSTDLVPGAPERLQLAQLLEGTRDAPVQVANLFPRYIRAPNDVEAEPVEQLLPDGHNSYLDVEVDLKRERRGRGSDNFVEWWVLRLKDAPPEDGNILPMIIFNDKVSPPSLGFLAGYGVMGLYVSIVLVIGKFVRGFFSEISHSIMFEELPCVDRILKLCQDIFLVRETGELELEEELYAKLIFLYRSPETMIKWTREK